MPKIEKEPTERQAEPEKQIKQAGPCVMVIFGATGDLTARKLFPALYNLAKSNMLSREFALVGVARNEMSTDQFRELMGQQLDKFATDKVDPNLRDWILGRLYYVSGEFQDPKVYARLAT